ncbi:hypothetical protein B0H17DRAFT_1005761 [Mycena rosella]|uniref:Ubiquitin-like domain-containing protein n=1 Tax=Mycena rosella TaxID=1033263 RepID=A0AAD7GL69_MYCRO|nr:hypothetical protein B0H17DRAFT_1005761 [Mycena rosella]
MSVDIRVELPAFSRTLNVKVPDSCTILDVKREIYRTCVGAPRVEGQRIIWRGRPLLDTEKVQELWQSPDEHRVVHLAVHPSAWSGTPPDISPAPLATPSPSPLPLPSPFLSQAFPPRTPQQSIFAPTNPFSYVSARHQQALNALEQSRVSHLDPDTLAARFSAVQAVERHGWSWPSILDDEFPAATEGGVKYERTIIEGQSYLRLVESAEQPTAIQLHALNVLASTFPILALPIPSPAQTRVAASQHLPNVNVLLQQLGIPAGRNPANANLAPNINLAAQAEIPLRPLLLPLFLLLLRTAVLLYFFAPARKPVFGILIVMWMLYEVWRPIRDGVQRGWNRAAAEQANVHNQQHQQQPQQQQRNAPVRAAGNGQANPGPAEHRQGPAQRPGVAAANDFDQQMDAAFDGLANFNIQAEEETIRRGGPADEPGLGQKLVAFVTLLVTTMHPAVWNRRRAVLRQREGQIRMDANARAAELDETVDDPQMQARVQRRAQLIAQHEQRPRWLREYMDRAVEGGWVDEAD